MAHKVHPFIFRLGILTNWKSRWLHKRKTQYSKTLEQDIKLREFLFHKLKKAGVDSIEIERSANLINIIIRTARPGLVIGRGGGGVEDLKKDVRKILNKLGRSQILNKEIRIEIQEVRQPTMHATIVAEEMASQIERRMPYRRVMKQALDKVMNNREVQGVKVQVKGRLNGAEIARKEWLKKGKISLQTIRSNIDYAQATAYTTYGTVGIKVWICKGEFFGKDNNPARK